MANEVSTFMTNASSNLKENVDDAIYTISPMDTIFLGMIKNEKAEGKKVEWLEDVDRAAAANSKPEEWDGTVTARTQPTRKYNYTQIFGDSFQVTDTMETAAKYGRSSEIEHFIAQSLRNIARDIEYGCLNNSVSPSAHSSGVGGNMQGAKGFITTNTYTFSGSASASNVLTETLFNDGVQKAWSSGGKPDTVIGTPLVTRKIAGFTGNTNIVYNQDVSKQTIGMNVNIYRTQFGDVKVYTSRYLESSGTSPKYDYMMVLEKAKWAFAWLKKTKVERQGKKGLVTPVVVSAEGTLKAYNEAANFMMSNIAQV